MIRARVIGGRVACGRPGCFEEFGTLADVPVVGLRLDPRWKQDHAGAYEGKVPTYRWTRFRGRRTGTRGTVAMLPLELVCPHCGAVQAVVPSG